VLVLNIILGWWTRGILLIVAFFIAKKSGPNGGVWSGTRKGGSMDESINRTSYNSNNSPYRV